MTENTPQNDGDDPSDLLKKGLAAANAGQLPAAEAYFRAALKIAPTDPGIMHNLGLALFDQKKLEEAEALLGEAHRLGGGTNSMLLLAEVYERQGKFTQALECYRRLLESDNRKYELHAKIAGLLGQLGDSLGQEENYLKALEARPGDPAAFLAYVNVRLERIRKTWSADPEAAVNMGEDLLKLAANHPRARAIILRQFVCHKEWYERLRRGEAPYHVSRLDEVFFHYARDHLDEMKQVSEALLAAKPHDDQARVSLVSALFCQGDRHGAEKLIHSSPHGLRSPSIWQTVRFASEFYDELRAFSDEDLVRSLPEIEQLVSIEGDPKGTVYLSCNFSYFVAFALPMVMSLRERSPGTPIHLHVMDASSKQTKFILELVHSLRPRPIAVSIERPGLEHGPVAKARCYYHAVRFIRFYNHLRSYRSPLWLMDVDAIVNRDLRDLFRGMDGFDVAFRARPGRIEPWNQFNACMIGATYSEGSLAYFRLIAAYVAYFHQRDELQWGIDQMAMYGVFADLEDHRTAPSLALLGPRDVDYDYDDTGYVWPNSGAAKMSHLNRIATAGAPPSIPPGSKFDVAFERFWQETVKAARSIGVAL